MMGKRGVISSLIYDFLRKGDLVSAKIISYHAEIRMCNVLAEKCRAEAMFAPQEGNISKLGSLILTLEVAMIQVFKEIMANIT